MLGGKGPLPDIPQANGYGRVLLAIAFDDGSETTLLRSMAGGQFQSFEGLHTSIPDAEGSGEIHNDRDEANLSSFLLSKIGLSGKRIKKNAKDETQALSFRNIARLAIVNEEEIIQKRSPLSNGNYTANTANTSVFTMLLTGVDDTALLSRKSTSTEDQKRLAQIDLLDQLIADAQKRITTISGSRDCLIRRSGLRERWTIAPSSSLSPRKNSRRSRPEGGPSSKSSRLPTIDTRKLPLCLTASIFYGTTTIRTMSAS